MNIVIKGSKQGECGRDTCLCIHMLPQIGNLAHEIQLWIQIDKKDFMHDINQCGFKVDG